MDQRIKSKPKVYCGPSRTQKHYLNDVNINQIMDRAKRVGVQALPLTSRRALYGDFSNITDYYSCYKAVSDAQANFAVLPAKIRDYFNNDPGQLISFLDMPGNIDKAIELGLVEPKEKPVKVGDPAPVPEDN